MANIFDIAEAMLLASGDESDITNLKLNKLLYFAQGTHLARTGKPLFDDEFEAWTFGPVVPSVYRRYSVCGRNPIETEGISPDVQDSFSDEENDTIVDVMIEYGKYSAGYLVDRSHAVGSPWCETPQSEKIPKEFIREFFLRRDAAPKVEFDLTRVPTIGTRDAFGRLVLPAAFDEDWGRNDEM